MGIFKKEVIWMWMPWILIFTIGIATSQIMPLMFADSNKSLLDEKKYYLDLINKGEESIDNYYQICSLSYMMEQFDEAENFCLKGMEIDPNDFDILTLLANIDLIKSEANNISPIIFYQYIQKAEKLINGDLFRASSVASLYESNHQFDKALKFHKLARELLQKYEFPIEVSPEEREEGEKWIEESIKRVEDKINKKGQTLIEKG